MSVSFGSQRHDIYSRMKWQKVVIYCYDEDWWSTTDTKTQSSEKCCCDVNLIAERYVLRAYEKKIPGFMSLFVMPVFR